MAPENFMQRFRFNRGEIEAFFSHPVWQEVQRQLFHDVASNRAMLEKANPADPDGTAKILRAQGELGVAKRIYGLHNEFVLHCVAKDGPERAETERRIELWKRLKAEPPTPEQP
ncbi:MAG TPA: hypothetical protein PKL54_14790 [Candidatus Hydrogenedentes bacterium]|nr:hypothetical protein [Candidatus Hydrogenedentota bacterium]HOH50949.1 hypothetical protein [Candidatus Hydrogenedentota bacterium]